MQGPLRIAHQFIRTKLGAGGARVHDHVSFTQRLEQAHEA